jgi:hypothetical protein
MTVNRAGYHSPRREQAAAATREASLTRPGNGAMSDLFGGIRAPSTLGSHLRSYTWGNVRQLETVSWLQYPLPARAAGALRGDERQHVDRSYMIRRPRDHREEHLQVIRGRRHRVGAAPAAQEVQV